MTEKVYILGVYRRGAVVQLGERMTGSHEVGGSTPPGSTKIPRRCILNSILGIYISVALEIGLPKTAYPITFRFRSE